MKKVLSVLLALVMVFSLTTPVTAATKPSTKKIKVNAGTYYEEESLNSNVTIKVTNVTSQKTKDYSTYLSDDDITIEGKKSKVIYCKGKTTVSLETANAFGFYASFDSKKIKPSTVTSKMKYYSFDPYSEEVDTSKTYSTAPEEGWVLAKGSKITFTKAGTYVLYVRPFQFYGNNGEDFELNPIFIVVKK